MHRGRLLRQSFLPFVAVVLGACAAGPTALPPPDSSGVILGEWSYASAPVVRDTPSLNTGLRVTIAIDSLDTIRFRGRVTFWFEGDVGFPRDAFGPVTGTLDQDGAVTMRIPFAAPGAPAITIVGTVAGDVLTVSESRLGANPGPFPSGGCFERSPP
jgi:hypothetical protein